MRVWVWVWVLSDHTRTRTCMLPIPTLFPTAYDAFSIDFLPPTDLDTSGFDLVALKASWPGIWALCIHFIDVRVPVTPGAYSIAFGIFDNLAVV
ncbi:hypothetical protein OG21DRAFT_1487417 [Imleria badia]|nr:hypothetical protein OG21DRAFT_1487417 [Imleria badia]